MKINILLVIGFAVFLFYAFSNFQNDDVLRTGGTQLNDNGFGCACHSLSANDDVKVWITGPDMLAAGETAEYKMFMTGGPAIAGGYNVAARFGKLNFVDTLSLLIDNELTQSFPLIFPSIKDTIFWPFLYTAPDSVNIDTIYSTGLSVNYDGIPTELDLWNYGPKFEVYIQKSVPVELISFGGNADGNNIQLTWATAAETNNKGFEVERFFTKNDKSIWKQIGFIKGSGTSTEKKYYNFLDENLETGRYKYRLKQIDFDGTYKYSEEIVFEIAPINTFELYRNYPNPFNPSTKIGFRIPQFGFVSLRVFDVLANEVAVLINEEKPAGEYEVEFNGANLVSGIYIFILKAGQYSSAGKMIIIK